MTDMYSGIPEQKVYTVAELTVQIKHVLEESFRRVTVEGEISNFVHYASGHMYFSLKDSEAQVRCVMFRGANRHLAFKPENGAHVRVSGSLSVYGPRGEYQLIIADMQPAGVGELHLAFEQLKRKLQNEGLFDSKWKKPIPAYPRQIGIVTSPDGAAISDIVNVITRRYPLVDLVLCPARVQGNSAAAEIVRAIRTFENCPAHDKPDVLIVGRGGGSIEDLWPFNAEIVARAVFHCSIPVISAVGHETDFTICDFVADMRAPTPSAAAESAVPDVREIRANLHILKRRLSREMTGMLDIRRLHLDRKQRHALFQPSDRIRELHLNMDRLLDQISGGLKNQLHHTESRLSRIRSRLTACRPDTRLADIKADVFVLGNRIVSAWKKYLHETCFNLAHFNQEFDRFTLKEYRAMLNTISGALKGHNPRLILKKGYAICALKNNTIVSTVSAVKPDDVMNVELIDGFMECRVDDIRRKENEE